MQESVHGITLYYFTHTCESTIFSIRIAIIRGAEVLCFNYYLYRKVNWMFIHVRILLTFESMYSLQSTYLISRLHIFQYNTKCLYHRFSPKNMTLKLSAVHDTFLHQTLFPKCKDSVDPCQKKSHIRECMNIHMHIHVRTWLKGGHRHWEVHYGSLVKDPSSMCSDFCLWCKQNCQKDSSIWITK